MIGVSVWAILSAGMWPTTGAEPSTGMESPAERVLLSGTMWRSQRVVVIPSAPMRSHIKTTHGVFQRQKLVMSV
jgi:hypothetical protein